MSAHSPIRPLVFALAVVLASASISAEADVYTWIDAKGNLNLSNLPPPEGTRVTNVFREDPAVHAKSEAARAVVRSAEVEALAERVKQLEQDLDAAKRAPPAEVTYVPMPVPVATPAPYQPVLAQAIVAPPSPAPYADCGDPWGNCFFPGSLGFYPAGIVVLNAPAAHQFHARPGRGYDHKRPPMRPPTPPVATPVGALPDPPNLFPGTRRR